MDSETRIKKTWFGVNAKVNVRGDFLHISGVGPLMIPHPGIANLLLRTGLPGKVRRHLVFAHEFAHFQTVPVIFLYMCVFAIRSYLTGRTGFGDVVFILISVHAAWEILSECLVAGTDFKAYREFYRGKLLIPQLLFWTVGTMLVAAGGFFLVR
ncbi:MAG: hypothetical protein KKF30_09395 [Proteobacteria bacterium]|nr:hypothetical protein [Pseudomonadota bacterium]MBU4470588.1 hypothetical protein [Pseudomonadota bacterium]MCG2751423.1 hypothetical protein [Desulfobacteraceae bacterium]